MYQFHYIPDVIIDLQKVILIGQARSYLYKKVKLENTNVKYESKNYCQRLRKRF